ncbi:aldose 1-epimerase family protein [Hymenobacter sp. ASUV-10]|uniref:Aldose 1-epimerase family protein n=1 Tax=Hymenobacter aranciens TaxID=3063996 RepID=A0ABT9BAE7_9BACT|nr:aldose 1-epimerase family protein [Hymenobacter sp. ASUV-10]MDO7874659.1 aldose 1-epimerase family protein [Hymenobacter sp. ASUV-10]
MYTLTSATAHATLATHGAELTSFVKDGLEYLWQADPAVWGRHAPVLFPIVGRLPEDAYLHNGQAYKLTQHGFARDREFAVVSQSDSEIVFRLTDDEASRAAYPFAFELTISYTLRADELEVRWQVRNPSATEELLFSIGAHPAFRCPLLPEEKFEDYFFAFDHPVTAERHLLQGGLLNGETTPSLQNQTELPLTYGLFADDALVFKHYDFTRVALRSRRSPHFVRVRFDGFPYLGLWTKGPGAEFVCIEPWQGIASSVGQPAELRDKEGILSLPPRQQFEATYSITIG